jgi:hypothetical protein
MVRDADSDFVAFTLNPFVAFGVEQIVWDNHDDGFL